MKKKIVVIMMAMCLAFAVTACGGGDSDKKEDKKTEDTEKKETEKDSQEAEKEEETQTKVEAINLEASDGSTLVYTKHELTQDYEGKNAVRVYFTYTNKGDEGRIVQYAFHPQVFQNGVECQLTTGDLMNPVETDQNLLKEVLTDGTLEVSFIYPVDPAVPLTLKVSDLTDIINGAYQEQEIALQ